MVTDLVRTTHLIIVKTCLMTQFEVTFYEFLCVFEKNVFCSLRCSALRVYQLNLIDHSVQILYVVTDLFPTLSSTEKVYDSLAGDIYVSHCSAVRFCLPYFKAMLIDAYKFFIFLIYNFLTNMTLIVSKNIWGGGVYLKTILSNVNIASFLLFLITYLSLAIISLLTFLYPYS